MRAYGLSMWTCEHTETTTAPPSAVWARWADPATWPEWDPETTAARLDGPFEAGTSGSLTPAGGPAVRFVLTEVTPGASFADCAHLPLARVLFEHIVRADDTGSRFTHRVTVTGPLAPVVGRLLGRRIAAGLPHAMRCLARLAEASRTP